MSKRTRPRVATVFGSAPDRLDTDLGVLQELDIRAGLAWETAEKLNADQACMQARVIERQEGLSRRDRAILADGADQLIHQAKGIRKLLEASAYAERKEEQEARK